MLWAKWTPLAWLGETSQHFSLPSAHPAPAHLTCTLFLGQSKFTLALNLELSFPLTLPLSMALPGYPTYNPSPPVFLTPLSISLLSMDSGSASVVYSSLIYLWVICLLHQGPHSLRTKGFTMLCAAGSQHLK